MTVQLGDCLDLMPALAAQSVNAIVTDPPYGLGFMGKGWDHGVPAKVVWQEALRVVRPGAFLLAFGGTRTSHRLTCNIEDAGWRIRDVLCWLYGSGFPKSRQLKPGWEPIVLASAPGKSALQIEAALVPFRGEADETEAKAKNQHGGRTARGASPTYGEFPTPRDDYDPDGRWPPNVALDEVAAAALDTQSDDVMRRAGGASRFFYCAKASRAERDEGLEGFPLHAFGQSGGAQEAVARGEDYQGAGGIGLNRVKYVRNHHPTVKPVALMRWLCRLVTPTGGLILDPFAGSGTTGIAAALEGFRFIGMESQPDYVPIARARITHAQRQPSLWEAAGA